MSLKTWTQEFYPTKPSNRMSKKAAIKHSLRKWEGLKKSVLKKHGVQLSHEYGWISDPYGTLHISSQTCALCEKYLDSENEDHWAGCNDCPLADYLGRPCDYTDEDPYMIWRNTGNPLPMIKALKKIAEEA